MHDDDRTALAKFSVKKFHELEYVTADPYGQHENMNHKNTNQRHYSTMFF